MANYLSKKRSQMLFDWLPTVGPDDWHRVASSWNWDYGDDPLRWIIQQEQCDKATALHVFWHGEPGHYYRSGAVDRDSLKDALGYVEYDTYDMLVEIVQRWKTGYYTRSELTYPKKPWNHHQLKHHRLQIEQSTAHPALAIPADMVQPLDGRKLDRGDLEEGIPTFICVATRDESDES